MSDRFWSKVNKSKDGCWEWTGALCRGYGWFHMNKKPRYASRVAAFLVGKLGSLDSDLHVLHSCDNPKCCNPDHLFVGTNADNVADRVKKGRTVSVPKHGESNGASKLSNQAVKTIRGLYFAAQTSQSKLAKMFGVKQPHISRIVNNVRCGGVF